MIFKELPNNAYEYIDYFVFVFDFNIMTMLGILNFDYQMALLLLIYV